MVSRPSPISGAIVGLLLERPSYGYDLSKRLGERLGPTWQLGDSSVYGVLDGLEAKHFVRREARALGRPRARERVMHYATSEASEWFEQWIRAPSRTQPVRIELIAKLAVARPEHLGRLREALEAYERECLRLLAGASDLARPRQDSFRELIVCMMEDAVVGRLKGEIQWARRALRRADEYLGDAESR